MAVFYLDTSALLKQYMTEKGTDVLDELFENIDPSERLLTSRFTLLEITSVLTRLKRSRNISEMAYNRLLNNFAQDLSKNIKLSGLSDVLFNEATDLIKKHALRAPDAIQLASALLIRLNLSDKEFYFISSDAKLNAASENERLLILNPESEDTINVIKLIRSNRGTS